MNNRLEDLQCDTMGTSTMLGETKPAKTSNDDDSRSSSRRRGMKQITKQKLRVVKKKIVGKRSARKSQVAVKAVDEERTKVMDAFYGTVEELQTKVTNIQSAAKTIEKMTQEIAVRVLPSREEKKLDHQVCTLVNDANQTAQTVRAQLEYLQEETNKLQDGRMLDESDLRIRVSLTSAITRKFIDELRLFQAAQKDFKDCTTNKFKRQVKFVQPNITDEQVVSLIRNGEDRDTLFQEFILNENTVNQRIQSVHRAVTDKHEAILQIEQSVAVVHRMFLELALLTEEQGIQLDRIEAHMKETVDNVEAGNDNLVDSIKLSKKIRRKKIMTILLAAGVTLVIVLVVVL